MQSYIGILHYNNVDLHWYIALYADLSILHSLNARQLHSLGKHSLVSIHK
jgi:hypothetical protein